MVFIDMQAEMKKIESLIKKHFEEEFEGNDELLNSFIDFIDREELAQKIWISIVSPIMEKFDDELIDMENKVEEMEEEIESLEENSS